MTNLKRLTVITLCLAACSRLSAQSTGDAATDTVPQYWDLQTCIDYAKEHNITIRRNRINAESTEEDVKTANVEQLGPLLEHHERFPARANIGFMQVLNRKQIKLRVFERGAGETQACGTGACAAVAVGIMQGLLDNQVEVELPGGKLMIEWQGVGYPLYMTGDATFVYDGNIQL